MRPEHIQRVYADLRMRGLSPQTVLHVHRVLREALTHALKWGVAVRNVCDAVDPPRPARKEMTALDAGNVARFLEVTEESPYRDVFHTLVYTGLRRSEALALKCENVNPDNGTISVTAGLHRLRGEGLVLLPVKTAKSRRQIDITPEVVDRLRGIRGDQLVSQAL